MNMGIHSASFMTAACKLYQQMGFGRCPEHDLRASAFLRLAPPTGEDVVVIACRMNLAASPAR